jgi:adenylate cyclase
MATRLDRHVALQAPRDDDSAEMQTALAQHGRHGSEEKRSAAVARIPKDNLHSAMMVPSARGRFELAHTGRYKMGRDAAKVIGRSDWISRSVRSLVARAALIGVDPADGSEIRLQKLLAVLLFLGTVPLTTLWTATYFVAGAPLSASIPGTYSVLAPINTAVFAWTRNLEFYRFTQLLLTLLLPWLLMLSLGGFSQSSVVIIWAALTPLTALLLEELRRTIFWILGFVVLLIVSAILQPYLSPVGLPAAFVTWFFVLNVGTVVTIIFALLYYFVGQRNFFQARSETLLLNILPKEISEALKVEPRTIAAHHDAASILFADVVEFTPMAAAMTPLKLVDLLNEVFHCFDALVEKYDLEKIKTIGDSYMVAAGVPRPRPDHAKALVRLALDMQAAVAARAFGDRKLAIRIGVNSGPVVAGVIGRKKFSYDLWGETVNMASRMESHGRSGAIQITRNTYELIKDEFICEGGGTIKVKGADQMEVWRVVGRRTNA